MNRHFYFLLLMLCTYRSAGQTITLSRTNVSLGDFFVEVHRQTGYFILYSTEDLKGSHPITVNWNQIALREALNVAILDQPVEYALQGKTIQIRRKAPASGDYIAVAGVVQAEDRTPLGQVSVGLVGSNEALTITADDGSFALEQIHKYAMLQFTHVGYDSRAVPLEGKKILTVTLTLAASKLDEVQLIAYGSTTRRMNTGDVSSLSKETIADQPVSNITQALQGRITGLYISQQTGMPGGASNLLVRGQSSLHYGGSNPLYIVDGVPYGQSSLLSSATSGITLGGDPLNELNPGDIERIDVLKDADATAIYGSRGANGVILISTKKGRAGKAKVGLNASTGFGQVGHYLKMLTTPEYLTMRHEAFANDGQTPGPYDTDLTLWDTTRYTDWQKTLLWGKAAFNDFQASVSGGSAAVQYLLSGGYNGQGSVFPGSQQEKKTSFHTAVNAESNDRKFTVGFTASYLNDASDLSSADLTASALSTAPDAPALRDSSGKLIWNGYFANPLAVLAQPYHSLISNLLAHLQLQYQWTTSLKLSVSGGYNTAASTERTANPVSSFNPVFGITTGSATFASGSNSSWIVEPQLDYSRAFGDWVLSGLFGGTAQQTTTTSQTLYGSGYSSDLLLATTAGAGKLNTTVSTQTDYRYMAAFLRGNLQWKSRYLLNLTGRRDGSSRFGPGKRLGSFGSIGAGWIFSEEPLLRRPGSWLSFGKARVSYGITGNDRIGDYGFLSVYTPTAYAYNGTSALYPTSIANDNYSWEVNKKAEVGIDLGFFKDRLLLSAVYYRNRSSNQLVGETLPYTTGVTSVQANLPATVQNDGWEFELNSVNLKSNGVVWKTAINLTIPRNKLIAFANLESSNYARSYAIGKPLTLIKGFRDAGVDPESGLYVFRSEGQSGTTVNPLYPDDLVAEKSIGQQFYGGMLHQLQYHRFQLDVFIQFVQQVGFRYPNVGFNPPGTVSNQPDFVMARWQQPGDKTSIQKFSQDYGQLAYQSFTNQQSSNAAVGDASFVRLKNVSLSYAFSPKWTRSLGGLDAKVFFRGQNLATLTGFKGLDPETQTILRLPPLRTWTVGIQCNL